MKLFNFLFFLVASFSLQAQRPNNGAAPMGASNLKIGRVYGRILDENKKAMPYASVTINLSRGKKDSLVNGALSEENGDFNIPELAFGRYKVKVTSVGYKEFSQMITVRPPDNVEQDLGDIKMEIDATVLNEVQINSEKSQSQLAIDKQVFNVGRNAASVGGTAEDVLKAVPSVTLDADGVARLRNNSTTVYLDGRPTPLALNQIPADQIEKVEVITNPSSKYEAQSSGGIINIVMKRNKKPGYNGFLTLGIATGNRWNGTFSMSYKQGKNNFTSFFNRNQGYQPSTGFTNRTNLNNGAVLNYFDQINDSRFSHRMQLGNLAWERQINNRNTLTLTGNYRNGQHNMIDNQNYAMRSLQKDTLIKGIRTIDPDNDFTNLGVALNWKKTFPKKGKELSTDFNFNRGFSSNAADWLTTEHLYLKNIDNQIKNTVVGGNTAQTFIFQLDYTNPLNDSSKVEYGVRSSWNVRDQQFVLNLVDEKGISKPIIDFTQDFLVKDYINAAYFNYGSRWKGINYQAGIRYEQSNLNATSRIDKNGNFGYNYPRSADDIFKALFPSIYFSKKLKNTSEIQLNMSRKINRPDWMRMMPIIRQADRQNVQIGNPKLNPEFINLVELNYNKLFKGNNWLCAVYFRDEQNTVVPIAYKSTEDTSVLINTFANGTRGFRYGIDNTLKLEWNKKLEFTTNINAFKLFFKTQTIEREGYALNGKVNLNYKFPKDYSVQANYNYESPRVFLQGTEQSNHFMDLAFKKDITLGDLMPSKRSSPAANARLGSVTFSINDVFNTRRNLRYFETDFFIQNVQRRRELRYFKLTAQVFFGKPDASIFKRKAKPSGGGDGGMGDF